MSTLTKYYGVPFAISGNRATVPVATQPDGSVNYTDGYGVDYALDPTVDPNAILIERTKFNQILYDITNAIGWLQSDFPFFAGAAQNGGVPVPYGNGTVVRWSVDEGGDGQLYQNTIVSNINPPPGNGWVVFLSQYATITALNAEVTRAMAAEALKAPIDSPIFTGSPQAPTQLAGTTGNLLATCAFVATAVAAETARAIGVENTKAPINSPAFSGNPTAPYPVASNSVANAQYASDLVTAERNRAIGVENTLAPIVSPGFSGVPTTPTPPGDSNDATIPNTAWVKSVLPNISPGGNLLVHYARINVPIGGSFALGNFNWDGAFPNACLAAVASAETNTVFNPSSAGNNFSAIAYGYNQNGGAVRIDTEQGGNRFGNVPVSIIGIGF